MSYHELHSKSSFGSYHEYPVKPYGISRHVLRLETPSLGPSALLRYNEDLRGYFLHSYSSYSCKAQPIEAPYLGRICGSDRLLRDASDGGISYQARKPLRRLAHVLWRSPCRISVFVFSERRLCRLGALPECASVALPNGETVLCLGGNVGVASQCILRCSSLPWMATAAWHMNFVLLCTSTPLAATVGLW